MKMANDNPLTPIGIAQPPTIEMVEIN